MFETDTGVLRYDANRNGRGAAVRIATLRGGRRLRAKDIQIVSV